MECIGCGSKRILEKQLVTGDDWRFENSAGWRTEELESLKNSRLQTEIPEKFHILDDEDYWDDLCSAASKRGEFTSSVDKKREKLQDELDEWQRQKDAQMDPLIRKIENLSFSANNLLGRFCADCGLVTFASKLPEYDKALDPLMEAVQSFKGEDVKLATANAQAMKKKEVAKARAEMKAAEERLKEIEGNNGAD